MEALQEDLISFMFLRDEHGQLDVMTCLALWFGKSNTTDIAIKTRFGHHVAAALAGSYASWTSTARGCLALMILIDQFPRNIYRHTIQSFSGDTMARSIATLPFDWLRSLAPEECIFVPCLIMTHQEDLASQRAGVAFYETLEPHLPPTLHIFRTIFEEHLRIIELCGTFPHRDHYYNRATTPLGKQLMENPKVRFDLPLIAENGCMKFGHDPRKLWLATQRAFDALERIEALANETGRRGSVAPASWLDEAEVAECHETFRAFDKDGNGFFDRAELATVLASTGRVYTPEQLQVVMDRISGVAGTSRITFEQFSALFRAKLDMSLEARAKRRFSLFDVDKSGEIDLGELRACIQSMDDLVTGAEVEEMLKACDVDGNGQVSLEEFVAMMPLVSEVPKVKKVEVVTEKSGGVVVDVVAVQELGA
ncbi:EF-hand [Mytilinidion resinicola]|uniref:Calmodulin n=1 Tax=Mytilinidion resinicola TaxID=574789 RepID=A0A6A6YT76_9PEZI|nr:EF-hand [Mytilinidion resinicola]KAF2812122.1 EF-hand [Mytilinidion resinicola]